MTSSDLLETASKSAGVRELADAAICERLLALARAPAPSALSQTAFIII